MNYSRNFERDYNFYLLNKDIFDFCGTNIDLKYNIILNKNGKSAKEAFFNIDSRGKILPCYEPELLKALLICKGSINFHIKMWADGVWRQTLLSIDIQEIIDEYVCPEWVEKAINNQVQKIVKKMDIVVIIIK